MKAHSLLGILPVAIATTVVLSPACGGSRTDFFAGSDAATNERVSDSAPAEAASTGDADVPEAAATCTACEGSCGASVPLKCCAPLDLTKSVQIPSDLSYVYHKFQGSGLTAIEFDLTLFNDPGANAGHFFAPVQATAVGFKDVVFYFGVQTDLVVPSGDNAGKGFILTRFGAKDPTLVRKGKSQAFVRADDYEGAFAEVLYPYPWKVGTYHFRFERNEEGGNSDWFDLHVLEGTTDLVIGGIKLPRVGSSRAVFSPSVVGFHEAYLPPGEKVMPDQIVDWHIGMGKPMASAPLLSATSVYPKANDPYGYPNSDVSYETSESITHIRGGRGSQRCHSQGILF